MWHCTVHAMLEEGGALPLLSDPLLSTATAEISAGNRPRFEIQRDIKAKERARSALTRKCAQLLLSLHDSPSAQAHMPCLVCASALFF